MGGQNTDKIRLVNRFENEFKVRLNGVTFVAMDSDRKVVFQHIFNGIDEASPQVFQFDVAGNLLP